VVVDYKENVLKSGKEGLVGKENSGFGEEKVASAQCYGDG
jgi:hypothetical protein